MTRAEWLASLETGDRVDVRQGTAPDKAGASLGSVWMIRTRLGRLHAEGYGRRDWRDGMICTPTGWLHIAPLPEDK